tara:strand:+ start:221 stop:613 length:393 start_codon:yes stop_codon:yes gene_type:complete
MAIPLGTLSGTEVLRRGCINAQSSSRTDLKFDGTLVTTGQSGNVVPANHIIIMMNIIFVERGNQTNDTISMWAEEGGVLIQLLQSQPFGAYETFVWNERFALVGGMSLRIASDAAANFDIWYSYIDQSWV